jgi:DNA polymerase
LYREQAAVVFNRPVEKIGKDSFERFIGKGLILGCGFNMGYKKFAATCAAQGRPVDEELAKSAVAIYRETNKPVVELWRNIERAAIAAVQDGGKKSFEINRVKWTLDPKLKFLFCTLPSGRRLAYYNPSIEYVTTPWEERRPVLKFYAVNSLTKKWAPDQTYGGKLVENVVQGIARDLMAEAMLRIDRAGDKVAAWQIVLSVHDELVSERDEHSAFTLKDYCRLMEELPTWAEGCPVAVTGWSGKRYKK